MKTALWDKKGQEDIKLFLENVKSSYAELIKREMRVRAEDPKKFKHLTQVVEELEGIIKNHEIQPYIPSEKPVCKGLESWLKVENLQPSEKQEGILAFLLKHYKKLHWEYGYDDLPGKLKQNFAFGEVIGSKAALKPNNIALGFVLLARDTTYPKHVHEGVDELYVNLGGNCIINEREISPGQSYHVIPGLPHEIQTGKQEMVILLYTWLLPRGTPENYELKFLK